MRLFRCSEMIAVAVILLQLGEWQREPIIESCAAEFRFKSFT